MHWNAIKGFLNEPHRINPLGSILVQRFGGITMESYDRLVQLVQDVTDDMAKCEGGNKAAGTRVRKSMQEIKASAQDVRKEVLALRSSDG